MDTDTYITNYLAGLLHTVAGACDAADASMVGKAPDRTGALAWIEQAVADLGFYMEHRYAEVEGLRASHEPEMGQWPGDTYARMLGQRIDMWLDTHFGPSHAVTQAVGG